MHALNSATKRLRYSSPPKLGHQERLPEQPQDMADLGRVEASSEGFGKALVSFGLLSAGALTGTTAQAMSSGPILSEPLTEDDDVELDLWADLESAPVDEVKSQAEISLLIEKAPEDSLPTESDPNLWLSPEFNLAQ